MRLWEVFIFPPNYTTTDNVANLNVIVLNQNGDCIKKEVNVNCTFTNTKTSTILTQTSSVAIEGLATCVVINGDQNFVNVSAVATAEGVLSIPNTFNLPGTGFTAN